MFMSFDKLKLRKLFFFQLLKKNFKTFFSVSILNVPDSFKPFAPHSAADYRQLAQLTTIIINQTFPALRSLAQVLTGKSSRVSLISDLVQDKQLERRAQDLGQFFNFYGSDKASKHNYHIIYGQILCNPEGVRSIFEIGLGTNNTRIASNMGVSGKPGASLRAFRDFCPSAHVFGADVDREVLFEEDRIKTFFLDQTDRSSFQELLKVIPRNFDLFIDDGLHAPSVNLTSLEFGLQLIREGGSVVIEDIKKESLDLWHTIELMMPSRYEARILEGSTSYLFVVKRLW
jgi:hypothetical protein